jgi:hypothetical protein
MQVYQTDNEGFYVGSTEADPDQLDVGNWLIPAGCVTEPPPTVGEKQLAQWTDGAWVITDVLDPVDTEPDLVLPPTFEQQQAARAAAYRAEADPLFFMSQRGEATTAEWTAKVAEIKARFPYPEA